MPGDSAHDHQSLSPEETPKSEDRPSKRLKPPSVESHNRPATRSRTRGHENVTTKTHDSKKANSSRANKERANVKSSGGKADDINKTIKKTVNKTSKNATVHQPRTPVRSEPKAVQQSQAQDKSPPPQLTGTQSHTIAQPLTPVASPIPSPVLFESQTPTQVLIHMK
jgi:hypothetical protein